MACDRHPVMHQGDHIAGNNVELSLMPETKVEADHVFAELSKDGVVDKPLKDMFWGSYFGTCKDKFGIKWMFDTGSPSTDGKADLDRAAAVLRDTADQANEQAQKLEALASGPYAKKAKTSTDKGLEAV